MGDVVPLFKWYDLHENVRALADWLRTRGTFVDAAEVLRYFDNPRVWTSYWIEYQEHLTKDGGA